MGGIEKIIGNYQLKFDAKTFMQGAQILTEKVKQLALTIIAGVGFLVSPALNEFMKLNPNTYTAMPNGGFSITLNAPQVAIIGMLAIVVVCSAVYFSNKKY